MCVLQVLGIGSTVLIETQTQKANQTFELLYHHHRVFKMPTSKQSLLLFELVRYMCAEG